MSCDREQISRLMDGRLAKAEFDRALAGMGAADAQETWRLYHVVGDALRSPDLAAYAGDTDLVRRLRGKLGPQEPVAAAVAHVDVRAPAANDHTFRWKLAAGAASFAAVAAVSWGLMGSPAPDGGTTTGPVLAMNAPSAVGSVTPESPLMNASFSASSDTDDMARDPELDRLLAAHRQMAGEAAFGRMAGFIRSATTLEGSAR